MPTLLVRLVPPAVAAVFATALVAVARVVRPDLDIRVRYALAFTFLELGLLGVLAGGLVLQKAWAVNRERTRRDRTTKLAASLAVGSGDTAAMAEQWPSEFLAMAAQALRAITGSERARVVDLVRRSSAYRELLRSIPDAGPRNAAEAVRLLGSVACEEAWHVLDTALTDRSDLVRVAALKEMLEHGTRERQTRSLAELGQLDRWQRMILYSVSQADSPAVLEFLKAGLNGSRVDLIEICLEFVTALNRALPVRVPETLSRSPQAEIRIRFFKALPCLVLPEAERVAALRHGLSDSDWRVRAMAAKACEHFRPGVLVDDLLRLCSDFAHPAEAGHAARAVARLGGEGRGRLRSLLSASSDVTLRIAAEVIQSDGLRTEA